MPLRGPAGAKCSSNPTRSTVSLSMSNNGTNPHRVRISVLRCRRFRGSGTASSGVRVIRPPPRGLILSHGESGNACCKASSSAVISARSGSMNSAAANGLASFA